MKAEPYSSAAIFYQLYSKAVVALVPDNRIRTQLTGITPIRYKNRLKCARTSELLLEGDDTLDVICEKLNVSSSAFLRTMLLHEMGKTPKQIRKEKYYM